MREENELFSMLLSLKKITYIFFNIGDSIKSDIDLSGYGYNQKALRNTILLLEKIKLIEYRDNHYDRELIEDESYFRRVLVERLYKEYDDEIFTVLRLKQRFDSDTKHIYFEKNTVPLKFSGLMMLLEDLGEVFTVENRWIVQGDELNKLLSSKEKHRVISLKELEMKLLHQKEIGAEAEERVISFEKKRLKEIGVNKSPIQVSEIDVTAGYDILSYGQSETEEIFIEVKCVDNKNEFHFTNNEIATAKRLGKAYWLYLVNRINNSILRINNPYATLFLENSREWGIEPDGYIIHKL